MSKGQVTSVQSFSRMLLFATPWAAARQTSLSIAGSRSLLKPMFVESVRPSSHLILCRSLLLLPSVFPDIRVFSNKSVLHIRMKIIEKILKELGIGRIRNRRRRIEKIKKELGIGRKNEGKLLPC